MQQIWSFGFGLLIGIPLFIGLPIYGHYHPYFCQSLLYQHMFVFSLCAFIYALPVSIIDGLLGFPLFKLQLGICYGITSNDGYAHLLGFIMNLGCVYLVYWIGSRHFGFNDVIRFY